MIQIFFSMQPRNFSSVVCTIKSGGHRTPATLNLGKCEFLKTNEKKSQNDENIDGAKIRKKRLYS